MEYYAVIYVSCRESSNLSRITFFLDGETRPDFYDEVSENEHDMVDAFEDALTPNSIRLPSDNELIAEFHPDDLKELEAVLKAVELLKPDKLLAFFADDEETQHYYQFTDNRLQFIYSEIEFDDPEDNEKYNQNLTSAVAKKISNMEDKGEALAYLASNLA